MPAPTAIGRSWFGRAGVVLTSASAPFLPIPTAATPPVDAEPAALVAAAAFSGSVPTADMGGIQAYAPNLPQVLSWLPTLPTSVQVDSSLGNGQVVIPNARTHLSDPAGLNPQITVTDNSGVAEFSVDGSDNVIVDTVAPDGTDVELTITAAEPALTTTQITDNGSGANRPITMGIPFAPNQLASGVGLVVKRNSVEIPTQWDQLATWRDNNGQAQHGALTFLTDLAGSNSGELTVEAGTPVSGTPVSKAEIAAAMINDWAIQFDGYSLSVRDLLDATVATTLDYTHLSGPIVSDYVLGGKLRLGGNGTEHPDLQGYFSIRGYKSGGSITNIYMVAWLSNCGATQAQAPAGLYNGVVSIIADGAVVKTGTYDIHRDANYVATAWLTDPQIQQPFPAIQQIFDSLLVPNLKLSAGPGNAGSIDAGLLASLVTNREWNSQIGSVPDMSGGGAANWIGMLDLESAAFLISGDANAYAAMVAVAEASRWVRSKFGEGWRPRDTDTGLCRSAFDAVLSPTDSTANAGTGTVQNDEAHLQQCGLLPYIITARYDFLEEMQLVGLGALQSGNAFTDYSTAWLRVLEERGKAWAMRELANQAVLTPDSHPLRASSLQLLQHAYDEIDARIDHSDGNNWRDFGNLGWSLIQGNSMGLLEPGGAETIARTWMHDYLTAAIGRCYQLIPSVATTAWGWRENSIAPRFDISASPVMPPGPTIENDYDMVPGGFGNPQATSWAQVAVNNYGAGPYSQWVNGSDVSTDNSAAHVAEYFALALSIWLDIEFNAGNLTQQEVDDLWTAYNTRARSNWASNGGYDHNPQWANEPRVIS
ncbi:MAG: hypothetical protein AAF529_08870 [Pseudomonadota bacterium]